MSRTSDAITLIGMETAVSKDLFDTNMPPSHPGEILREDVLPRLTISQAALARHIGIDSRVLAGLLREQRPITLELAQRLGAALGTGARYWLSLQMCYDIWAAQTAAPVAIKPLRFSRNETGRAAHATHPAANRSAA